MSRFHPLRIASVASETRDGMVLTFEVPVEKTAAFRFKSGQHLTLRARIEGEELRRSYSICSAPSEGKLRIAIKRVPGGLFSSWAHAALRPGQSIDVMEPSGGFHALIDPAASRHQVAFAVGSGITPVLSILKVVLAEEPKSRVTLIYGSRSSSSVLFKEELEDLKDRYLARFNLIFMLSREHQEIDLFNGRLDRDKCDRLLEHWLPAKSIDVAYLCGPQTMMQAVSGSLLAHGVGQDRIWQESFSNGGVPVQRAHSQEVSSAPRECRVSVLLDGRRREFFMPRGRDTLLDAALEQGLELPYSCKGGVCSTCRCRLTAGEVDMDTHFALEDYEIARGFILTCQSFPLTEEIALDFDTEG